MKKLVLELNKRLLIVEKQIEVDGQDIDISESIKYGIEKLMKGKAKFICKGPDLTEEIAKGLVDWKTRKTLYKDYKIHNNHLTSALESFISAIEEKGYYWGENPIKHPDKIEIQPDSLGWYKEQEENHLKAESRTFHLEKTLIFEIV